MKKCHLADQFYYLVRKYVCLPPSLAETKSNVNRKMLKQQPCQYDVRSKVHHKVVITLSGEQLDGSGRAHSNHTLDHSLCARSHKQRLRRGAGKTARSSDLPLTPFSGACNQTSHCVKSCNVIHTVRPELQPAVTK